MVREREKGEKRTEGEGRLERCKEIQMDIQTGGERKKECIMEI